MNWIYDAVLPGRMTHTIQVEADRDDVDFNLIVLGPDGREIARDDAPAADATCTFDSEVAGKYELRIELVRGRAGFSLKATSRPRSEGSMEAIPKAPTQMPPASSASQPRAESQLSGSEVEELVEAHNRWRARYGVDPLRWSDELAAVAQDWAERLAWEGMRMRHRSPNQYGENIYWCAGKHATPDEVVDAWGSEVEFYDPELNNWWPKAGHWSQVVWSSTTHVGGGVARVGGQEMWVCNYAPRGNWTGERPF